MKDIKQELAKLLSNYRVSDGRTSEENYLQLMQQAYNLGAESKWISVEDELPKPFTHILLYTDDGRFTGELETYDNHTIDKEWSIGDYNYPFSKVTHWQPLPPPPTL